MRPQAKAALLSAACVLASAALGFVWKMQEAEGAAASDELPDPDVKLAVTDGPFTEAKEVVGGYAVFEFATKEAAVAAAVEFMDLHKQFCPGWEGTCEVRAIVSGDAEGGCGAQDAVSTAA